MGDKELGIRLKTARENAHLTQASVCDLLNIPKTQTLSAYERGVNSPPLDILKELVRLYGVSTDSLLFGDNNIPKKEKSPEDYVRQLVEAVDNLKLTPRCDIDGYGNTVIYLSNICYDGFDAFLERWADLRQLRDNKTIEPDEYEALITRRLNSLFLVDIASMEPDACWHENDSDNIPPF